MAPLSERKGIILPAVSMCALSSRPAMEISYDGADWRGPLQPSQPVGSLWVRSFDPWGRGQPDDPTADIYSKQIWDACPRWDTFWPSGQVGSRWCTSMNSSQLGTRQPWMWAEIGLEGPLTLGLA